MSAALQPPTAPDSERVVLSHVVGSRDALDDVSEIVRPEDFSVLELRAVYIAALAISQTEEPYDLVGIRGRLADMPTAAELLFGLAHDTWVSNLEHHARIVAEKSRHRHALSILHRVTAEGYASGDTAKWLERVETSVYEITVPTDAAPSVCHASEAMREAVEAVQEAGKPAGDRDYIPASIPCIARAIMGWDVGYMHVVGARPGVGKTSFVVREVFALAGKPHNGEVIGAAMFSMEMPKEHLSLRALAQHSTVGTNVLRKGQLSGEQWASVTFAANDLGKRPVMIDDTPSLSIAMMRSRLRKYQAQLRRKFGEPVKLRVVGVDYLQLMDSSGASREEEIAAVSLGLRRLAKEFGVALIAVASLNREQARGGQGGKQRRPQMSDLRSSGQIEFDAATIGFLYNPTSDLPVDERTPETTMIFAKSRRGEATDVKLHFNAAIQLYVDPDTEQMRRQDELFGTRYDTMGSGPDEINSGFQRSLDPNEPEF